jgi:hypothetical protein
MGQIVTYELIPGGKGVAVTNENKIRFYTKLLFNQIFLQLSHATEKTHYLVLVHKIPCAVSGFCSNMLS